MWSAACSAPHLQFNEGTNLHLCIVELNSPKLVFRQFGLTQEGLGRVIPSDERPGGWNKCVEARGIFLPFHIPLTICPKSCGGIRLIEVF